VVVWHRHRNLSGHQPGRSRVYSSEVEHAVWKLVPITLRSLEGELLPIFGRSPLIAAKKTFRIVLAALKCRNCAVDFLQERSGRDRQDLFCPHRVVTEDRDRRVGTWDQSCEGAVARRFPGVLVAGLRLVASKILATASNGGTRHVVQVD